MLLRPNTFSATNLKFLSMIVAVSSRFPMRRSICLLTLELLLAGCFLHAQTAPEARSPGRILLKADRILDIKTNHYIEAAGVLIPPRFCLT